MATHRATQGALSSLLLTQPPAPPPCREKVEKRCEVRKELPGPKAGELPLPAADKLPAGSLGALPAWADLPWPAGQAPALPAKAHPSSVLDFKGGETVALARCWAAGCGMAGCWCCTAAAAMCG